jgi:hypothetical protein
MKPSRDVLAEMGGVVTEGAMGGDFFDFYERDANAEVPMATTTTIDTTTAAAIANTTITHPRILPPQPPP